MERNSPFMELSNVWKSYSRTPVLRDVSLTLRQGEVHAIVGENGAGKSTLAKIIGGRVARDRGEMRVRGRVATFSGQRSALKMGIGTVSQELTLAPSLTVLDNVVLGMKIGRLGLPSRRRSHAFYEHLVETSGIDVEAGPDAVAADLSRGEQQKVEVLRALAQQASCLVLDEPTASLNDRDSLQLLEVIDKLRIDGIAVFFVSHDLSEVERVADRITVLRDGGVTLSCNKGSASRREIIHAMLGRALEEAYPARGESTAPKPTPLLELSGVDRSRTDERISLRAFPGETIAILGLVGSEGAELARLMTGGRRARPGQVSVAGAEWRPKSYRSALQRGVGLLPESRADEGLFLDRPLVENLTVQGNKLGWFGVVRNVKREAEAADELMRAYRVAGGRPGALARQLSGGNQQKAMIAKTLYSKPRIVVAINPTIGVDIASRLSIYETLKEWARQDNALIVITDDTQEAYWMADRVYVVGVAGQPQLQFDTRETSFESFVGAITGVGSLGNSGGQGG
jgi:ABC-type sugar transport system ATPase subunit